MTPAPEIASSTSEPLRLHVDCPRCGYELSGEPTRWTEHSQADGSVCPLGGQCPECGLTFEWSKLFVPVRNQLPWFSENQSGAKFLPAAVRTVGRAIFIQPFWREVSLENKVSYEHIRRWLLWVSCAVGAVWVLYAVGLSFALEVHDWWRGWTYSFSDFLTRLVPWRLVQARWGNATWTTAGWFWWAFVPTLLIPAIMFLLPETRARSKVQTRHLLRAFSYSLVWMVPVLTFSAATKLVFAASMCLLPVVGATFSSEWLYKFGLKEPLCLLQFNQPWGAVRIDLFLYFPILLWLIVWWALAIRTGFRMQEWRQVLVSVSVPAFLVGCISLAVSPAAPWMWQRIFLPW